MLRLRVCTYACSIEVAVGNEARMRRRACVRTRIRDITRNNKRQIGTASLSLVYSVLHRGIYRLWIVYSNPVLLEFSFAIFFFANYVICESQKWPCLPTIPFCERSEPTHPTNLFYLSIINY